MPNTYEMLQRQEAQQLKNVFECNAKVKAYFQELREGDHKNTGKHPSLNQQKTVRVRVQKEQGATVSVSETDRCQKSSGATPAQVAARRQLRALEAGSLVSMATESELEGTPERRDDVEGARGLGGPLVDEEYQITIKVDQALEYLSLLLAQNKELERLCLRPFSTGLSSLFVPRGSRPAQEGSAPSRELRRLLRAESPTLEQLLAPRDQAGKRSCVSFSKQPGLILSTGLLPIGKKSI